MHAAAFKDRHAVLDPQQRLVGVKLGKQETGPAAVARMRGEQLRQGGAGRNGQMPSSAQPAGELNVFGRTACAAGDQGKASSHTTHNASVLLLFFVSRLRGESQSHDSQTVSGSADVLPSSS